MAQSFVIRQGLKKFGADLVRAAYRGILGRQPDPDGLRAHTEDLGKHGQLRTVLQNIAQSPEAWHRNVYSQPLELARQLYLGVNGFEATPDDLERYAKQLSESKDIPRLLATMAEDSRFARGLLQVEATGLVDIVFTALLGRPADDESLRAYSKVLMQSGNLEAFVREVGHSPEHHAHLRVTVGNAEPELEVTSTSTPSTSPLSCLPLLSDEGLPELVRHLNLGIQGFEATPYELDEKTAQLRSTQDLPRLIAAMTDERRKRQGLLEVEASALVDATFKALLSRPADAPSLAGYAESLAQTADIESFLRQVGSSNEHIGKLLPRSQSDKRAIEGLFMGLLERPPHDDELLARLAALAADVEFSTLVKELVAMPEFQQRHRSSNTNAADLVRAAYAAMLLREPDPVGMQHYSGFLTEGGSAVDFLKAVGASEEHWLRQVDRRAETLVRVVFEALLQREPDAQALASYAAALRASGDLKSLIAEVGTSREHREKLLRAVVAKR